MAKKPKVDLQARHQSALRRHEKMKAIAEACRILSPIDSSLADQVWRVAWADTFFGPPDYYAFFDRVPVPKPPTGEGLYKPYAGYEAYPGQFAVREAIKASLLADSLAPRAPLWL